MQDYSRLTKAELIERLRALEKREEEAKPSSTKPPLSTRDRLADAALQDSEERLRAILDTAVEGIITIDERGLIESVNPAAENTFGYRAEELIGKNVSVLMPSPYREEHDGYIQNYRRTGHAKIIGIGREVVGRRKDGSVFPMELAVSEVRLADKRLFTGFVRDITGRKQLESEVLRISELEQRRIGQDLHDGICQQLAGIELMSLALEQSLASKSHAAAQASLIAGHVRTTIAQTRSLAYGLSPVAIESEGLMAALVELAESTETLFKVRCRLQCDVPVLIEDNIIATHLFRIAQEAVTNAIKHGKARRIEIALTKETAGIVLSVTDDGMGLPDVPAQKKGMGLRIMRYRADVIGGTLVVQHGRSGGTVVRCSLPTSPANQKSSHS